MKSLTQTVRFNVNGQTQKIPAQITVVGTNVDISVDYADMLTAVVANWGASRKRGRPRKG